MALLRQDCPRCGTKNITFEVKDTAVVAINYGWQEVHELFCVCRHCFKSTVFVGTVKSATMEALLSDKKFLKLPSTVNEIFEVNHFITIRDRRSVSPPDHVPDDVRNAFIEGATCIQVECWNAAGVMFRTSLDLATRSLLPDTSSEDGGPNHRQRRDLGLRLPWLFDNGRLPEALRELSSCVQQDGNDGAHQGTLSKEDALDLQDFSSALLERLYTEPKRLALAAERRAARRSPQN